MNFFLNILKKIDEKYGYDHIPDGYDYKKFGLPIRKLNSIQIIYRKFKRILFTK